MSYDDIATTGAAAVAPQHGARPPPPRQQPAVRFAPPPLLQHLRPRAARAPAMESHPVSQERRVMPSSSPQQEVTPPSREPEGLWDRMTAAPLSSFAPRAPSRAFMLVAAPIKARYGNLAYFVWVNRGNPADIQFVQGSGVRITNVKLNGRVIYDGETSRVGFDRMPVVQEQGQVEIHATVQPWQGPGVELGIFRSSSDDTTGANETTMTISDYVDLGLDAVTTADAAPGRALAVAGVMLAGAAALGV